MGALKFILVLGVVLFLTAVSANNQYVPYSYTGASGPEKWGSLSLDYAACSLGKSQSPINIEKKLLVHDVKLQPLLRSYNATNATLINNGFNVGMSYGDGGGSANIEGKVYTLKQMHWHTPSEHTLNGERLAAELHFVHISKDGSVAVVAVLYKYGKPDPLLSQIKESLAMLIKETYSGDQGAHVPVSLKTRHLGKKSRKYFRYMGSLTVPPCSENVTWTVLGKVREISKEQVEALKEPLNSSFIDNSRPLQALNGRNVQLYDEMTTQLN